MKSMFGLRIALLLACGLGLAHGQLHAQSVVNSNNFTMDNGRVQVTFSLQSSNISYLGPSDRVGAGKGFNALDWAIPLKDMPKNNQAGLEGFAGQFICLGRWGSPSAEEKAVGIPHNGGINTHRWTLVQAPKVEGLVQTAVMSCTDPVEKYKVTRTITMRASEAGFKVDEVFENLSPLGRITNVVQHATFGPGFITENTVFDCNAYKGFDQAMPPDSLNANPFTWPEGNMRFGKIDLRRTTSDKGYVATLLYPSYQLWSWVAATTPEKGYSIGYIFKTADYPWLNLWHYKKDGVQTANGLEFGTTGKGEAYTKLLNPKAYFMGQPSFSYIEAKEKQNKSYYVFVNQMPSDIKGIAEIQIKGDKANLVETGGGRTLQTNFQPW